MSDADEPVVVAQKSTPLFGQQRAVGLQAVEHSPSAAILLLQLHGFLVERQGAQHGLAAVPREVDVVGGLGLEVALDVELKHFVAHDELRLFGRIKAPFVEVVAIGARQVACRADRLGHHIQRLVLKRVHFFSGERREDR